MFNMVYTCLYKVTTCIYTQLSLSFFWRLRQRRWHRLGNRCLSQCQDPQADPTNPRLSTWTEVGRLTHPSRAKKNLQEIWETTPGPRPQRGPGEKMPGNKKHKIQEIHVLTKLACLVLRSFATPQSEIFAYVYLLVFQGSTNEVTPIECVFREQTQTRTCTRYPHQHSRRTGLSPKSPTGFSLNKDAAAGMFLLPCNKAFVEPK